MTTLFKIRIYDRIFVSRNKECVRMPYIYFSKVTKFRGSLNPNIAGYFRGELAWKLLNFGVLGTQAFVFFPISVIFLVSILMGEERERENVRERERESEKEKE